MKFKTHKNEAATVCSARKGDKQAIKTLLTKNWPWLKGLVASIVGNESDTDDVLQNVCITVIEKIHTLREPERFRPWLAILTRRQALKYRMTKKRNLNLLLSDEIARGCQDENAQKSFEEIEQKEQYQRVLAETNLLPEKYRQVLLLKYSQDLTYAQMAEILDVPLTTIQIRLVRARKMVYQRLTDKNKNGEIK